MVGVCILSEQAPRRSPRRHGQLTKRTRYQRRDGDQVTAQQTVSPSPPQPTLGRGFGDLPLLALVRVVGRLSLADRGAFAQAARRLRQADALAWAQCTELSAKRDLPRLFPDEYACEAASFKLVGGIEMFAGHLSVAADRHRQSVRRLRLADADGRLTAGVATFGALLGGDRFRSLVDADLRGCVLGAQHLDAMAAGCERLERVRLTERRLLPDLMTDDGRVSADGVNKLLDAVLRDRRRHSRAGLLTDARRQLIIACLCRFAKLEFLFLC